MKWIYIIIVLVITASALGCINKKQTDTQETTKAPAQPVESAATPTATSTTTTQEVSQVADFGTDTDLAAIDSISSDMDMEISLSNEI